MRRTTQLLAMLLTVILVSCGQTATQPVVSDKGNQSEQVEEKGFPISGKVVGILTGSSLQVQLETKSGMRTVLISENATVFFGGKPATLKSLEKGQTLYLESTDSTTTTNIVITDWPGIDQVGKTVSISTQMVTERLLGFIAKNHPELNLNKDPGDWKVVEDSTKIGETDMVKILEIGNYKFRMIWLRSQEEPEYDAILTKKGSISAIWSGRFRKDGKIIEERYEKP